MRPEAITDVLCLLCLFYVNSLANCPAGWFGDQCKYKCKCKNDACDATGECTGGQTCRDGWFGPACQYVDLAYNISGNDVEVDNDDSTCLTGAKTQVTIQWIESQHLTWLRAKVTNQGSAGLRYLTASFSNLGSNVSCTNQRKQLVDSTTLDIHCDLSNLTDQVILEGSAAAYICSVYVSGGRNVALKEKAWQSTDYLNSMTAEKAVDGNTNQSLIYGACSHTLDDKTNDKTSTWILSFSRPRRVHKYVIYNRVDAIPGRLRGFKLESFDTLNKTSFMYKDSKPTASLIYTIRHQPVDVGMILVSVNNSDGVLTLCEVEIYGESVCDAQHYGRECELDCQCPNNEACFVATGGCRLQCPAGLQGANCTQPCDPGTFGPECTSACNEGCVADSCDKKTGICDTGCERGFIGASCEKKCDPGWFGKNCSLQCSKSCQATGDVNVSSCDHETGVCVVGCMSGFGDKCNVSCSPRCAASGEPDTSQCNQTTGACIMGCTSGFGENCNFACSPSCTPSECKGMAGACITGCESGFSGKNCDSVCGVGKFGENCISSCSPSCAPSDDPTTSPCNPDTGACFKGCNSGYTGDDCATAPSKKAPTSDSNTELIVSLIAVVCALAFIGYFMCKKKQTRPMQEGASGRLPSAAEDSTLNM